MGLRAPHIIALLAVLTGCTELMAPLNATHVKMYVLPETAYVWSCPGPECEIVARLERGDEVATLRRQWFWIEVLQWGGVRGWMESRDLDTQFVPKRAPSPPPDAWDVPAAPPEDFSW